MNKEVQRVASHFDLAERVLTEHSAIVVVFGGDCMYAVSMYVPVGSIPVCSGIAVLN